LLFALGLHRCGEQRLLIGEVAVHGELGYAGLGGDRIHAAAVVTATQEQGLRSLQDRLALGRVLGAAGAVGWQQFVRHSLIFNTGLVSSLILLYPSVQVFKRASLRKVVHHVPPCLVPRSSRKPCRPARRLWQWRDR